MVVEFQERRWNLVVLLKTRPVTAIASFLSHFIGQTRSEDLPSFKKHGDRIHLIM